MHTPLCNLFSKVTSKQTNLLIHLVFHTDRSAVRGEEKTIFLAHKHSKSDSGYYRFTPLDENIILLCRASSLKLMKK